MRRVTVFIFLIASSRAQEILTRSDGGHPLLLNGQEAVLESGEPRKDLECTLTPEKPLLGFDLKFHAGYDVLVPMRELEGPGDSLTIVFRVSSKGSHDPVYFTQQFRVPEIREGKGEAALSGTFDVGEGSYHVDWLMHDSVGRFCSSYWDFDAALTSKDKSVAVAIPPGTIRISQEEQFQPEPPVERGPEKLSVKVLLNFAPQRADSASVNALDTTALVSILRNIAKNPKIGRFSVVAFNVQEQRVLYRQESSDHIDFPAMGRALKTLNLGTVDLHQLERKNGDAAFLASLIKTETTGEGAAPDGLIFVGPKTLIDSSVPQDDLKQVGDLEYPVFYMNYTADPVATPWKDAISRTVKFFKGREYTISGPRDLWNAVTEVVSRIAKFKEGRGGAAPTGEVRD